MPPKSYERRRFSHRRDPRRLVAERLEDRRMLAVNFQFDFIADNQIGFNDPTQGAGFKSALESAASRLGDQLQHDATIEIEVLSLEFTGSAVAHAASESQQPLPDGGFIANVIGNKILAGVDANGSAADGTLEIFFFDENDPFVYATDPAAGVTGNQLDLQAIITHELVHAIGFTSATNANGSDDEGAGLTSPGTWTLYDRFLSDSDGNRLIEADTQSQTAFQMDLSATGWPTDSVGGPGPSGGLFFDGPIATGIYGGRIPLYSPSSYSSSSTASHLDSEGVPGPSVFSPLTHLMSHATVVGAIPQELTLLEKAILSDTGIMFQLDEGYEFGRAASPYPVSLAENGARHFPSDLTLGETKDYEQDGWPAIDVDELDDDGVLAISDFVVAANAATNPATTASIRVQASTAATLDAWIDWNQDGDWNDPGEQIFVNQNVAAGFNHLSLTVPANASPGSTVARYRLSTQRDLDPTGLAANGEVEDYQVTVLDGSLAPTISVRTVAGSASLSWSDDQFRITSEDLTTFAAASEDIGSLRLIGDADNDVVTLVLDDLPMPSGGLSLVGNAGQNSIRVLGTGQTLDLTTPNLNASDFQHIDLTLGEANTATVDRSAIDRLSPLNQTILVSLGNEDQIDLRDAEIWRMGNPIRQESFLLTATNLAGDQVIQVETEYPWKNFLQAGDVNADGSISSSDALRIVNELARRSFSSAGTQQLVDPATLATWPAAYFDHNADNRVTALDALRVINDLADQSNRGEGEASPVVLPANNRSAIDLDPTKNESWLDQKLDWDHSIKTRQPQSGNWNATPPAPCPGMKVNSSPPQTQQDDTRAQHKQQSHDAILATWPAVSSIRSLRPVTAADELIQ
ncbi:MAG: GEVED domain-containing protein [Rubripirellula sp.]|nr:GEVED domain-containing protein [Rubripirellula sp.]